MPSLPEQETLKNQPVKARTVCRRSIALLPILLALIGCKEKQNISVQQSSRPTPAKYFQTPFQNEAEFVVYSVASDLAEQAVYAATHQFPQKSQVNIFIAEKPGSALDAPTFELEINLGSNFSSLKQEVVIDHPIWSPTNYRELALALARKAGFTSGKPPANANRTGLFSEWTNLSATTIEEANARISEALEKSFLSSELHEEAALLIGAFLLRDRSGDFFEIRSPLSRMTAHLAMAEFLRNGAAPSDNGRMAEAIMLTLVENQAAALAILQKFDTNSPAAGAIVRGLRMINTGDYRLVNKAGDATPFERLAWFSAMADYASTPVAWEKLRPQEKQKVDFIRAANQEAYSVEIGHFLLRAAIPLELKEFSEVHALARGKKSDDQDPCVALNELPVHCFSSDISGKMRVRVIGWGQWAGFFQRHLCHAVQRNFDFMERKWAVHDEAKEFRTQCDKLFNGLRLYPFVRRFNCTDEAAYHQSVDDAFKVTVATPHLVPAECWNYLCYKPRFVARAYNPNPNPHVNEWHKHNPLPRTVYDLNPRLDHPSLTHRADKIAAFEKLHAIAPNDCRISRFLLSHAHPHPTYEQAAQLYGPVLDYSVHAMHAVADAVTTNSPQYLTLISKAAGFDPSYNYDLAEFALGRHEVDKAAEYYDKACEKDPDAVRVSQYAQWRVRYYLNKGKREKARQIADDAGEVYSYAGLQAKAIFFELTSNYNGAFDYYEKIEERYDESGPLLRFCIGYKSKTGDKRFDKELERRMGKLLERRMGKLFPQGLENASLAQFTTAPVDGVLIRQSNDLVSGAGLKVGDIIVAAQGIRVHGMQQYTYARETKDTPELDLIVWQGNGYRQIKASPPQHRFGVDFGDYATQTAGIRTRRR